MERSIFLASGRSGHGTESAKSTAANAILKDITVRLQEPVNNPLAIIGVTTEDLRRRFISDPNVARRLDQIDSSIRHIHIAIKDVAAYESGRVLEMLTNAPNHTNPGEGDSRRQPEG